VIVAREAAADLDRLRAFLAGRNPDAARRAVEVLICAIESLHEVPNRDRPSLPGISGNN
jgi:plasmid stabilization system protein ParE